MPDVTKRLGKGTLTTSNATLVAAPGAGVYYIVKSLTICNKTSVDDVVTFKLAGTEILYQHPITAKDSLTIPFLDHVVHTGELIEGNAGANSSLTYYISGIEVS